MAVPSPDPQRRRLNVRRAVIAIIGCVVVGSVAVGVSSTWATFTGRTHNTSNSFSTGTVVLSDNSAASAMLNVSNLRPGDTMSSCIIVNYTGSVPANVVVYGNGTGSLGTYLNMTLARGTSTSAFPTCAGFTYDNTNYVATETNGVIWAGTAATFPAAGAAVVDPTSSTPAVWTSGTSIAYRVDLTMQDNSASAGKSGTLALTWEARNT